MSESQEDFTRTEIIVLITMALAAVLIVYAGFRFFAQDSDVDRALKLISTLKYETQQSFQGQSTYTEKDIGARFGDTMTLTHPWEGPIKIHGNNQSFFIVLEQIPPEACQQIGEEFDQKDVDYISLRINDMLFMEGVHAINSDTLQKACASTHLLTMTWNYY